jgi:hypothetical protein
MSEREPSQSFLPTAEVTDAEIEERIRQNFEQNYERLRLDGGHALTPFAKSLALQQVLLYWRKMRAVATRVTDTEVKLTLPLQTTPGGRKFTIEGVVDIVREDDHTVMYDIKTHDPDYVRANVDLYEKQLNVYAHIWQRLRGQPLDETAIIATAFPVVVREALREGNPARIERALNEWDPLIDIPLDQVSVNETIADFGATVDAIEEKRFKPPSVETLREKVLNSKQIFATRYCGNCDARFSCSSFRNYAMAAGGQAGFQFSPYFNAQESDADRSERIAVTLESAPLDADLDRLI